jgi:hypothetical protein
VSSASPRRSPGQESGRESIPRSNNDSRPLFWPQFGGQVVSLDDDAFDSLLPKTSIDHLFSEEEGQKAEQERREFEAVGRTLFVNEASLYPMFYELVCERIASGVSPDEIRGEMSIFTKPADLFGPVFLEALEDALAGRPPRLSSTL